MTYIERTPNSYKAEIKQQFMSFFKTPDAKHLAVKKLKSTIQKPAKTIPYYDKIWKDLFSQIDYVIDEQLLIQWFLTGMSQNILWHISLDTFKKYEEPLTKDLSVEMDEDYPAYPTIDA